MTFSHWQANLDGKKPEIHENEPHCGFYRMRDGKDGPWLPVAIFMHAERGMICRVGAEEREPAKTWIWCAKHPVKKEDAKVAFETGRWPGDVDIGHNSGELSLKEEIADKAKTALDWLKSNGIRSQIDSDMAANHRASLTALETKAKAEKKALKDPHDMALDRIEAEYKPIIDTARTAIDTLRVANGAYLKRVEDEENARRRKAYEEEQARVRAEMERVAAERAKKMQEDPIAALTEPQPELPVMPPPPPPAKARSGGQVGKVSGLKNETTYPVIDHAKALAYFAEHEEVKALVQKLATKVSKAGVIVPGVEKKTERVAA